MTSSYLRSWIWHIAGLGLFLVSLPLYRSWEHVEVLGRWSKSYALFMAIAASAWLVVLGVLVLRGKQQPQAPTRMSAKPLLGWALFGWGVAYLAAALDSSAAAARILQFNITGSTTTLPAVLEWVAMVLAATGIGLWVGKRIPTRLQNAALMCATLAATLLLAEGLARFKALVWPETQGFPSMSSKIWERRYVALNSLGFRDVEHPVAAAAGEKRILVVGDSYAFGHGVDRPADRYGEQVLARLRQRSGQNWTLLNASRGDTHTLQHIGFLEEMLRYRPDLVVLVYVFNDIDYLSPVTPRPALLRAGGLLALLRPVRLLFVNSYLFQEIYVRWSRLASTRSSTGAAADPYQDAQLMQTHTGDLARFVGKAQSAGAAVRIVAFDNNVGVAPALQARLERFNRNLRQSGLPLCTLEGVFEAHDPRQLRVNSLDVHPNALANKIAAEATDRCLYEASLQK